MRTPGLAAITMVLAIAACSDVAEPTVMTFDASPLEAVAHKNSYQNDRKFGRKHDECRDDDRDHRWGKRRHHARFRHWGWRHTRRHSYHFRGHGDNNCEPEQPPTPATGSISGAVLNEGAAAVGYSVFLLKADGSVAATVATDAAGAYTFAAAAAGTYLVCEENPFTEENGFLGETRPPAGSPACPGAAYGPRGFSLVLAAGAALTGNNFSNMRLD